MAERSVVVRLRAEIADFKRQMREAKDSTKQLGDESKETEKKSTSAAQALVKSARENEQAWNTTGKAVATGGALLLAGAGYAVKAFADFDEAMSSVQAATHETADNMGLLRDAALEAGSSTAFSATEAAAGIEALSKAGVSTRDILAGGLAGALDLAAAGGLEVGEAAEIAATALTQFKLEGTDVSHVADLLAAGAGKAQGEVSDMALALEYAGIPLAELGVSIEETAGSIALFAKNGIIGEKAGTSLRSMIASLTAPTTAAARVMETYGISVFDAQGKFVGLEGVAGQLQDRLGTLTDAERSAALGRIFGNESLQAANVLVREGDEGIRQWTDAVNDQGFAAETAALKLDNLKGDFEALGGALETALISAGEGADGPLRGAVQRVEALVIAFNDAPPAAQQATLAVGATAGAASLLGGAALIAVPRIVELYDALGKMGPAGTKAQAGMKGLGSMLAGPWGIALAAGTLALGVWAEEQYRSQQRVDALSDTLDEQTGAITENTRAHAVNRLEQEGAFKAAQALGLSLETVTDAALGNVSAMREVDAVIRSAQEAAQGNAANYDEMGNALTTSSLHADDLQGSLGRLSGELQTSQDQTTRKAEAMGEDADATQAAADANDQWAEAGNGMVQAAENATDAIDGLFKKLDEMNGIGRNSIESQIAWEQATAAASEALKKNGQTLDLTSKAGQANMDTLLSMAEAADQTAAAILRETGSEEEMRASNAASRQSLFDMARNFGLGEEAAWALVDSILAVPPQTETNAIVRTGEALARIEELARHLAALNGTTAEVAVRYRETGGGTLVRGVNIANADGGVWDYYADGGFAENHVAQFAPAGANRIWAEPETGGEAYIPLAASKRDRSVAIWEETGDRLGLNFMRFADGGFWGSRGSSAPAAGVAIEQNIYPRANQSETEIGRIAGDQIMWEVRR